MSDDSDGDANRRPGCRTVVVVRGKIAGMTRAATLPLWRGRAKPVGRDLIMGSTVVMTCP